MDRAPPTNQSPGCASACPASTDNLCREWSLVVGTHFAGALVARDLGDTGPDVSRRYE
jgi:hypothetical protein